jgi:hypothetical protein
MYLKTPNIQAKPTMPMATPKEPKIHIAHTGNSIQVSSAFN